MCRQSDIVVYFTCREYFSFHCFLIGMRTGGMKTRGTLARPKKLDKVISLCWKSLRYRSRRREGARVELKLGSLCEWKWRRWLLAGVLWLAQVFMTSAYSMISSFFPTEVLHLLLYMNYVCQMTP